MKYSDLSSLLLKISGLLILILTLVSFPDYFVNYYSLQNFYGNEIGDLPTLFIAVAAPLIITISIALLLFVFPKTITNSLILKGNKKSEIDIKELGSVVYAAIGIYFVAFALSDLIYWLAYFTLMTKPASGSEYLALENTARVVASFGELVIGLFLIFGAKGINNFILKTCTASTK